MISTDVSLEQLVDERAICRTIEMLGRYSDDKEPHLFRNICVEDILFEGHEGTTNSIEKMVENSVEMGKKFEILQHFINNIIVDIEDNTATAKANLLAKAVHRRDRPDVIFSAGGIYHFGFFKIGTRWLIKSLRLELLWTSGPFDAPITE